MSRAAVGYALALLAFGALNTLSTKYTFQMEAVDLSGQKHPFRKPWFGVYRMFQGMAFVMLLHFGNELLNWYARRKLASGSYLMDQSASTSNGDFKSVVPAATPLSSYFWVVVPAVLDLLGTTCTYVGLFYNSPSVWQMFRGAMVVFSTFFSITILKRRMSKVRWLGVSLVVLAITIVGFANTGSKDSGATETDADLKLFGMGMILVGMLLQGGQVVVEEFLMKGIDAPPLMIVGMEGVWGCIIMWGLVFPVVTRLPGNDYGGVQENLANDLAMVQNSPELFKVIVVYLFSVFTFNIAGMMVTYQLSAVHRTMLEASRTAVIWTIDLGVHAIWPESIFGEAWNDWWSALQLLGFFVLVLGQATYGELITWGIKVPVTPDSQAVVLSPACIDPGMFASPSARSPAWLQSPGRTAMYSPKGQLDMGCDLPADEELLLQILERESSAL